MTKAPEAAQAALDVMLTDAADGGRSRFLRPGAAVERRRRPGAPARPRGAPRRGARRRARRASPAGAPSVRPAKRDRRFADPAWQTNWLFRRRAAGLPRGRRDRRRPDLRRRRSTGARERQARFAAGNVLDALAPTQLPVVEPGGAQGERRRGRREPRPRRAPLRCATSRPRCPRRVDTQQVRGRREPRAHAGLGRAAHRGLRAHPVRAADRARCARCRCCSSRRRSTSTTSSTSRPGRSMVEYLVAPGPAGVRDLLAQPGRRAGPLRPRHLRAARCSRRATRSRAITGQPAVHLNGGVLGRDHRRRRARPPRRRGPARRGREPDADRRARSTTSAPAPPRRSPAARSPPRRSPSPRAAATSTARRSAGVFTWLRPERPGLELRRQQLPARQGAAGVRRPVLEPGHRAARRRPAPRLHPPRRSTTRSRAPGALEVLGTPGRPRRGRRRQLHRRRPRPTTSSRGRTPTAARSCSAATPRFVLSTSGHIQALVNPPAPRAASSYRVADEHPADAEAWVEQAADAARQLVARLRRVARRALGRAQARAQAPRQRAATRRSAKAPGTYVHAS